MPTDLRAWLKRHEFTQEDLALILGVSDRCVRFWVAGKRPLPKSVTLLMRAADDGRVDRDWFASTLAQEGTAA